MREVMTSVMRNKMRIALTGFAIGWGIFILIVLISSGKGLINGMQYNFQAYNVGVVTLTPRETSQSFNGREKGRPIRFYEDDARHLKQVFGDTVVKAIPVISHPVQARYGKYYTNTTVDGYEPGYSVAPNVRLKEGRDINDLDMEQQRKVCVIPERLKEVFFPKDTASIIGRQLHLNNIVFEIIGIYEPLLKENKTRDIVAPLTTTKMIFCPEGMLSRIYLQTNLLTTAEQNKAFNARVLSELAARKEFSPADKRAVKIDNIYELPVLVSSIISVLYIFVIVVGLATLLSGIVGISNIMLISVKERTRELGIRRAVGAKAWQIIAMVLAEAVVISLIFGYVGMVIGIGLMELVAWAIEQSGNSNIFANPTIAVSYALAITVIMVIAGLIAGYVPAKHAVRIKLTDALSAA